MRCPRIPPSAGGPAPYVQAVRADGTVLPRQGGVPLPVNARAIQVAADGGAPYITDVHAGGSHLREITFQVPGLSRPGCPSRSSSLAR